MKFAKLILRALFYLAFGVAFSYLLSPTGQESLFIFNALKAGWMVNVDASIFIAAVIMLVAAHRRKWVVNNITLAHYIFGFLAWLVVVIETQVSNATGLILLARWVPIITCLVFGLRFLVQLAIGGADLAPAKAAQILNTALVGVAAWGLYESVSIDELFAFWTRDQFMVAQGWDAWTKFCALTASMVFLYGFLDTTRYAVETVGIGADWIERHGERAMYIVSSLIMYYIIRAVVQNGFHYVPFDLGLWTNVTGFATELLPLGFIGVWLLNKAAENDDTRQFLMKIFFIREDEKEAE